MARKRRVIPTQVVVNLPNSVELTKRNSSNMGRGSVQWWPSGNRIHALKKTWKSFAAMLDEHM